MSWRTLIPMVVGGCPPGWRLTRAISEGSDLEIVAHARACPRCGAEWAALARTSAAAHEAPPPVMSDESRERIAMRLLGVAVPVSRPRTATPPARAWRGATALGLLACGAAAGVVVLRARRPATEPAAVAASLASIRAVGSASFTRLQPPPDELLRLDEGAIELGVAASAPGHRFRIITGDAEIEVPAGRLSVRAHAHTLVAVRIFGGYAEVRAKGGGHAALRAGDEWTPEASPPATATERPALPPVAERPTLPRIHPAPARVVPPRAERPPSRTIALAPSKSPVRALLAPTPSEPPSMPPTASAPQRASFDRAWRLLRAGDSAQAAAAFREVEQQAGGDAISEDAAFWQAVALARANLTADARRELARFVARFPSSARVGEASAMLGWMLLDAGDADGARRAFERAVTDKVDRVRASAHSGLERLGP